MSSKNLSFQSLELLTLRRVSQYVDWMVGDHFDEGKKDLVKRLVKSYLPPIPTEYRHSPDLSEFHGADWLSIEEGGEYGIIRLVPSVYERWTFLGGGDLIWVSSHPNGLFEDFLNGNAADSGIARVVLLSLANPTRRMRTKTAFRSPETLFRVKICKTIPMEQLYLYFRPPGFGPSHHYCDPPGTATVLEFRSQNHTVVGVNHNGMVNNVVKRCYKQREGTWYDLEFDVGRSFVAFLLVQFMVVPEDRVVRMLAKIREGGDLY